MCSVKARKPNENIQEKNLSAFITIVYSPAFAIIVVAGSKNSQSAGLFVLTRRTYPGYILYMYAVHLTEKDLSKLSTFQTVAFGVYYASFGLM